MPSPLHIALLLGPRSSLPLSLLLRQMFERANQHHGSTLYKPELVSARGGTQTVSGIPVSVKRMRGHADYLLVPPYEAVEPDWQPPEEDVALVQRQYAAGGHVASACLGAFTLACAGVLDGRKATTHWNWAAAARKRHPQVDWDTRRILWDQSPVFTAGGYLAAVDLGLYLISLTGGKVLAQQLGNHLLADSTRESQSLYSQALVGPPAADEDMKAIAAWIDAHLDAAPTAAQLARRAHMSLRTFHRRFREAFHLTPRKYIQLKRVEAVRSLLAGSSRSTEQILEQVGVSDRASFNRVFQRELGCSPAQYRRRLNAYTG